MSEQPEVQPTNEVEARFVRRRRIAYFVCCAISIAGFAFLMFFSLLEDLAAFSPLPLEAFIAVASCSVIIFMIGRELLKDAQAPPLPKKQRWILSAICLVIFFAALAICHAIDDKGAPCFGVFAILLVIQDAAETLLACRMVSSGSE